MPAGSLYNYTNGAWKVVSEMFYNSSGVNKKITIGYTNSGGVWKVIFIRGIPLHLVALNTSSDNLNWTALSHNNYYIRANNNYGATSGAGTHIHPRDSRYTGNSSSYTYYGGSGDKIMQQHYHYNTHQHLSISNNPLHIQLNPIEYTGVDDIFSPNFIAFSDEANIPTGWTERTGFSDTLIKMNSSINLTPTGSTTYSHSVTSTTYYVTPPEYGRDIFLCTLTATLTQNAYHSHTSSHTHPSDGARPYYKTLKAISPNTDIKIIPIGVVALFTTSIVPFGWTRLSSFDGKYIALNSTPNLTGGNPDAHDIASNNFLTGSFGGSTDSVCYKDLLGTITNHTHSFAHGHGTGYKNPLAVDFYLYKRIF